MHQPQQAVQVFQMPSDARHVQPPQPAPQAPQPMLVPVPAGPGPGETVGLTPPAGVQMQVVVPSSVAEGEQFQVALPAAPVVVAATVVAQPQ